MHPMISFGHQGVRQDNLFENKTNFFCTFYDVRIR